MTHPDLEALIGRVEASAGPDRELDAAIYDLTPHALDYQRVGLRLKDTFRLDRYHDGWVTVYGAKGEADPYPEDLPRYTASLDAALSLVPEGMRWLVRYDGGDGDPIDFARPSARVSDYDLDTRNHWYGKGYTPVLALVAAALRARLRQGDGGLDAG